MSTSQRTKREEYFSFSYGCAADEREGTVTIYDEVYGDITRRWITVDERAAVPAEEWP